MNEIFADAVRSISMINGVVRIDLVRFDRNDPKQQKPLPMAAGQILMPVGAFQGFAKQMAEAEQRIGKAIKTQAVKATVQPKIGVSPAGLSGNGGKK
jgi:hypothetical protein